MESPLAQVQELLLAFYANKGSYPRPNAVTSSQINEIQRLAATLARDLARMMETGPVSRKNNDGDLSGTIRNLDRQVDTYEDAELLVRWKLGHRRLLTSIIGNSTDRDPARRPSKDSTTDPNRRQAAPWL